MVLINFKKLFCRKAVIIPLAVLLSLTLIFTILYIGMVYNIKREIHWTPDYELIDILPLLEKTERTDEDYETLFSQTGLTKIGINDLLSVGDIDRILNIQSKYFERQTLINKRFAPFSRVQLNGGQNIFADVRDGDIIVTSSTFVSWFRCGHAAIVVDGENELLLNAVTIGENSEIVSISDLGSRSNFMILRPKISEELRKDAATFAEENLFELPYDLTVGVLSKKFKDEIKGTHCSHCVWASYKSVGIDIDSNKGHVVTPKDISNSNQLELVQTFGFNPEEFWK